MSTMNKREEKLAPSASFVLRNHTKVYHCPWSCQDWTLAIAFWQYPQSLQSSIYNYVLKCFCRNCLTCKKINHINWLQWTIAFFVIYTTAVQASPKVPLQLCNLLYNTIRTLSIYVSYAPDLFGFRKWMRLQWVLI